MAASVTILGPKGRRTTELVKLFKAPSAAPEREHTLEPNEMVLDVTIPVGATVAASGWLFLLAVWRPRNVRRAIYENLRVRPRGEWWGAMNDWGFWIDGERRRIPDHWHAHARPAGGFFDPSRSAPWAAT